jgi:hypothetical protein
VELREARRGDACEQRVAQQRVREAPATLRGRRDDEPGARSRRERGARGIAAQPAGARHQRSVDLVAEHGRRLERVHLRRAQLREPIAEHLGEAPLRELLPCLVASDRERGRGARSQ